MSISFENSDEEIEVRVYKVGRFYRTKVSCFKNNAVVRIYDTHSDALIYANGVCDTIVSFGCFVRLIDESIK